jgi:hypothetical protein
MSAPESSVKVACPNIVLRTFALLYGVLAYLVFLPAFLYLVGFVGDLFLPTTIDKGHLSPPIQSIGIDLALLSLFAMQHSVMARPSFKRWWTRFTPVSIERSTYVLLSSLILLLLFWQWRPIPNMVWSVTDPLAAGAIRVLFWIGWIVALSSTFHQPLPVFWARSGVRALSQTKSSSPFLQNYSLLQLCEASALSRPSISVLGGAFNDSRSSTVCTGDDRLHSHRGPP